MKFATTILVFCVAALLSLGLVMLYSSSMSQPGANYPVAQVIWCGLGLVAAGLVACLDYRYLKKISLPLFLVAIALLVVVLVPSSVSVKAGGARRWLNVAHQSFQPSELAKLALVVLLAHYAERYQRFMPTFGRGLVAPALFIGLTLGLIFLEPDWGTTLLLAAVSGIILLVAGDQQDDAADCGEEQSRSPVRFKKNQTKDQADEQGGRDQSAPEGRHEPLIAFRIMGQQHHERQLGQFGRLKTLVGDTQPAAGAPGFDADAAGNQDHHKQRDRDEEQRQGDLLQITIVQAGDEARGDKAQAAPDDLGDRIIGARLAHAGAVEHHQSQ